MDVPEDELITRTEREGDEAEDCSALEMLTYRGIHSEKWALHEDDIATIAIEEGYEDVRRFYPSVQRSELWRMLSDPEAFFYRYRRNVVLM